MYIGNFVYLFVTFVYLFVTEGFSFNPLAPDGHPGHQWVKREVIWKWTGKEFQIFQIISGMI